MKRDQRAREQVSNDEQSVNEIKTQVLLSFPGDTLLCNVLTNIHVNAVHSRKAEKQHG